MKTPSTQTMSKYLITLVATIGISAAGVSAWVGLTAQSGDRLDYTKWNELVTAVQSAGGAPTGAVMAFNLASCPAGWSEYTAGQGRAIIGAGAGAGLTARTLGATGGGESAPAVNLAGASASVNMSWVSATTTVNVGTGTNWGISIVSGNGGLTSTAVGNALAAAVYLPAGTPQVNPTALGGVSTFLSWTPSVNISGTVGGTSTDNMQPFVALLYCQKN